MDETSTPITICAKRFPPGFENEIGMHRVQRVPPTERRGRVHTSTVAVALLDGSNNCPQTIDPGDLSYRWHSGTGSGGQHRNKTQNCLELTHLPTGISVSADGRSRRDNERDALRLIERAVEDRQASQHHLAIDRQRRSQAGDRSRSGERIRTWKLQDGMVLDHRSGRTARMRDVERRGVSILWS